MQDRLELRLHGVDLAAVTPEEESLLAHQLRKRHRIELQKIRILVQAITHAGNLAAGSGGESKLDEEFAKLRDLYFPELKGELEAKAAQTEALLRREYEQGAFQVQAMEVDYMQRRRQRSRKSIR